MTEETHGSSSGGVPELPSFLDLLPIDKHAELFGLTLHQWTPLVMSMLIIGFLGLFAIIATRDLKKIPGGLQAFLEIIVEALDNFVKSLLGKMSDKFLPFIGTLFLYILI
ncbi:MAG: F0F1 ATP synthase subunit A, partial [Candidatus Scalindua sp.]|nr:F0F1 ATP synthase subunit A [Candidatus Scalindua sp.]